MDVYEKDGPLAWSKTSKGSKEYKMFWNKIDKIQYVSSYDKSKNIAIINMDETRLIFEQAGSYIRFINLYGNTHEKETFMKFGSYVYKIHNFLMDYFLEMIIQFCHNITDIKLLDFHRKKQLSRLFSSNKKLKKLELLECYLPEECDETLMMLNVEELILHYDDVLQINNYEWIFPKLKKLDLTITVDKISEIDKIMNTVIPYVLQLKSLILFLHTPKDILSAPQALSAILEQANLEEFSFTVGNENAYMKLNDSFFVKMTQKCSKLRIVHLNALMIEKVGMEAVLSLPNLEELYLNSVVKTFNPANVMTRLTKIHITDELQKGTSIPFSNVLNIIGKMPALLELKIQGFDNIKCLKLTCKAIREAVSQNKAILIKRIRWREQHMKMKILKVNVDLMNSNFPTLVILMDNGGKHYFTQIEEFVKKSLKDCKILRCDDRVIKESEEYDITDGLLSLKYNRVRVND